MVRAVEQGNLHVHNGIARQNTCFHRALNTSVDGRDILLGDGAAHNGVDELVTLAGLVGLHVNLDVAVLAFTAGLTGVLGLLIHSLADGLLVGNLGSADVGLDLELPQQTVNNDLQVQLAHAGDDGLTGFLVGVGAEGGILFSQLRKGNAHLFLTGLGLGLNGNLDNRLGEDHGLQNDGVILIAEGIAGGGVLDADHGGDVAGVDLVNVLTVIGVHLQDTTHTLVDALGAVQHGGAFLQRTGVHTEVAQLAHIGVGSDLKGQSGEGCVVGSGTEILFLGVGVDAPDALLVQGAGHIVHDCVQQLLNALVLVGRTADDRHHLVVDGGSADDGLDLLDGDLLAFQIHHGQIVIQRGDGVHQLLVVLLADIHHVLGDILDPHVLAQFIIEDVGLHGEQIYVALEEGLASDGQLDGYGVALQPLVDHVQNAEEVGAHDIHLVDVDHAGDLVLVGLTPNGFGLGFHTALGAQNGHGAVQNTQRTLHLNGEVHVARGVNDVQPAALPEAGGCSGSDGDAALLLLCHPVHGGGAVVGLTDLVVLAGVEQDTLGGGGFAGIDVCHDAEVSCILQRILSRHWFSPLLPAEMGEGLVGFSHLVDVLTLLNGGAGIVGSIHDLGSQTLLHGVLAAGAAVVGDPAQPQGLTAVRANFDRHLIGSAADTASLQLHGGHNVFHCLLEHFQAILAGLVLDNFKCTIHDLLGNTLLAVQHDAVDELGNQNGIVIGIRKDLSLGNITSSGHFASLLHNIMISSVLESVTFVVPGQRFHLYKTILARRSLANGLGKVKLGWRKETYFFLPALGRFAPYLERDCIRFCTPWVSRVPRTMW